MTAHEPADSPVSPDGDVLDEVTRAITALESHADPDVRDRIQTLLAGIDAVHRAGLTHLVNAIRSMAGDALINRLVSDPAIRLLLMSYNLVAVDRRLQAEEALDTVRGHLHDHEIDVEILEVVGGVVYVRLHHSRAGTGLQVDHVRQDLEAALRAEFVGFQELVLRERDDEASGVSHVPLDLLRRANRPVYFDAGPADALAANTMTAVDVQEVPLLVARVDDDVVAVRDRCGQSPLPLHLGVLHGGEVECPWHGCRYDLRTGHRTDGHPGRVQIFPVSVEDGRIRVALDVKPGAGAD